MRGTGMWVEDESDETERVLSDDVVRHWLLDMDPHPSKVFF